MTFSRHSIVFLDGDTVCRSEVDDLMSEINAPPESVTAIPTPFNVVGFLEAFLAEPEKLRGRRLA